MSKTEKVISLSNEALVKTKGFKSFVASNPELSQRTEAKYIASYRKTLTSALKAEKAAEKAKVGTAKAKTSKKTAKTTTSTEASAQN